MPLQAPGWDEALRLGHPALDRQHQEILSQVQDLPQREDPTFDGAIQFFLRYTFDHFRDEEALMKEAGYPALQEHMADHRQIEQAFDAHFHRYLKDTIEDQEFRSFLNDWISRHILVEDRKFAAHLAIRDA